MNQKYFKCRLVILLGFLFFSACIPDTVKKEMDEKMIEMQQVLADQEFKRAIGIIEVHKLRNGKYPETLNELKFLSPLDSTMFMYVEYKKQDTLYELNMKAAFPSIQGVSNQKVILKYPKPFWNGLGCVKSNTM